MHRSIEKSKIPVQDQVSAGGVAFRQSSAGPEMVIISATVGGRWQLPKGLVNPGESLEMAALREVREEAGIETDLLAPIETIQYWYVGDFEGKRVRFHKFVHFFLLLYRTGDVNDHDDEVREAEWVSLDEAIDRLAFKSERAVVERARIMITQV